MSQGSAIRRAGARTGSWATASKKPRAAIEAVRLASEHARQVEAEAVDAHLRDPEAEAVHDQLQHPGVLGGERVAAAGVVDVVTPVGREAVVARVVDAAIAQGRAELVALAAVVVDDVEQHLDARAVQASAPSRGTRARGSSPAA